MVASHLVETKKNGKRAGFLNSEDKFLKHDRAFFKFKGWETVKMHAA